jgi:rubrerythrin
MSAISVQGEKYESLDDLIETIARLQNELEDMPSETPEHEALSRHIERLREAAGNGVDASSEFSAEDEAPSAPLPAPEEEEEEEAEFTHNLREAAETGALLLCPTCGQEVPFPETPPLDQTVTRCPNCDGWGKVLRPSRVDGHIWRDCPVCQAEGVVPKEAAALPFEPTRKAAPVPEAPGAVWNPLDENWSPPPGAQPPWVGATWDSFYGKWA